MRIILLFALSLCAGLSQAAPLRVGILSGIGPGRYWHTNIHTASTAIANILAESDTSHLGPNRVRAGRGFQVSQYGLLTGQGTPTSDQKAAFLAALDSLDVVVLNNNQTLGAIFPEPTARARLLSFFRTRGTVSLHFTTDASAVDWTEFDTLQGAVFANHPSADRNATLRLENATADASMRFLNRGLPDTARFVDEWLSFETSGAVIRSNPGLRVTVTVDEASYEGGMGGARAMGADHPLSWSHVLPEGGRFFYTAIGHRAGNYEGTGRGMTPENSHFLRRQIYNAILWAAKVDSNGTVGLKPAQGLVAHARIRRMPDGLWVEFGDQDARAVELLTLDGRLVQRVTARGTARLTSSVPGVHLLRVTSASGDVTQRVMLP